MLGRNNGQSSSIMEVTLHATPIATHNGRLAAQPIKEDIQPGVMEAPGRNQQIIAFAIGINTPRHIIAGIQPTNIHMAFIKGSASNQVIIVAPFFVNILCKTSVSCAIHRLSVGPCIIGIHCLQALTQIGIGFSICIHTGIKDLSISGITTDNTVHPSCKLILGGFQVFSASRKVISCSCHLSSQGSGRFLKIFGNTLLGS